jgi:hypothetical protein
MMDKKIFFTVFSLFFGAILMIGCSSPPVRTEAQATPSVTPSPTPDPCSPGPIQEQAHKVHDIMRVFNDIDYVANLTPQQQLGDLILQLEESRRNMEDLVVPDCVLALKQLAINYMNSVIGYMGYFMAGGDKDKIGQLIANSQQIGAAYSAELNRLLAFGTPTPMEPVVSPTPTAAATVTNDTQQGYNLRSAPALDADIIQLLMPGQSAPVLGRTEAGDWLLVDYEGEQLWLYTSVANLNVPLEGLPVMEPTPTATLTSTATSTP